MPNRVLLITNQYPSNWQITRGLFVYNLVQEFCKQGVAVEVIAPRKLVDPRRRLIQRSAYGPELATIRRPAYISLSNKSLFPGFSTLRIAQYSFRKVVLRELRYVNPPDIVYAHFLSPGGIAALEAAQQLGVPCMIALGESAFASEEKRFHSARYKKILRRANGLVAVSQTIERFCVEKAGVNPERITTIPNAADTKLFFPRDRSGMRRKLGWPEDRFIVAFVGHFIERKGHLRLLAALKRCPNTLGVFVGNGADDYPTGDCILHAGPVPHHELPQWLAAADIFVLPTLAEGSCNAVTEALATGLPLVLSDIPSMREQVTDQAALFVDPLDPDRIRAAILQLQQSEDLRKRMSQAAVELANQTTLEGRARRILDWIDTIVRKECEA